MQSASDFNALPAASRPTASSTWKGQWIGIFALSALLSFTWLPNSYLLMVSWPYCLWWQSALCLFVGYSIWISRQFSRPLGLLGYGLDWVVLLLCTASSVSSLVAQFKPVAGLNVLLFSNYGIVLYLVVNWLRQSEEIKERLWLALVTTGTVTHIISLISWQPTADMWSSQNFYTAIRNPWPLGHHNFVGGYCVLMLPLVVGFTLTRKGQWRWLGYIAIALNAITLYASGSRGALLGAVALGFATLLGYLFYHPAKTRKHWLVGLLICTLIASVALSNPRVRSLAVFDPSATNQHFSITQISDGPVKDRLFMLQAGQRILKDHPLFGIGPGNLSRVYNRYRPVEVGDGLDLVQQLHNTPAQILVELGIVGFSGYLLWIVSLVRLGLKINRTKISGQDRTLLYSIAASCFAYTVSSLTDYQLENIGIATILLITTALLIALADTYIPSRSVQALSARNRRCISLFLLLYLSGALQAWARVDTGFYLAQSAQKDVENSNLADANAKWMKGTQLLPWDPTPAVLSAEHLTYISNQTTNATNKEKLATAAIDSLKLALKAAPNDPWFNQNLAVLLLQDSPEKAEKYSRQAVFLAPRSKHNSYYTLGQVYLAQNKTEQAIASFVLESLANPKFLVDPIWQTPPLAPYLDTVVDQTLQTWQQILSETVPDSHQYGWLSQQAALIKWWYRRPLPQSIIKAQTPFIQLILGLDEETETSLALLEKLDGNPDTANSQQLSLLRTWLAPEAYFSDVLESFEGSPEEKQAVINNVQAHRDFRTWLTSVYQPMPERLRFGLALAYRNHAANRIKQILFADGLSTSYLLEQLAIFSGPPREFSQLDQTIVEISQQLLEIARN